MISTVDEIRSSTIAKYLSSTVEALNLIYWLF